MRLPPALFLLLLTASGCCSWDFEELEAARRPDDRREALACLAEDAEEDPALRVQLVKVCTAWVQPTIQPDPAVRATAFRVLRSLKAKTSAGTVQQTIAGEPTPEVRVEAVTTLAALAGPKAQEPLLARMAVDPDPNVRMASARELRDLAAKAGGKPDPTLTEAYLQRLGDAHQGVRLHARRGLRTLYPKVDHGLSVSAWRVFLKRKRDGIAGPTKPDPDDGPPPVPGDDDDGPPPVPPEPGPKPGEKPPKPEDYDFPDEPLDDPDEKDAPPKPETPKDAPPKPETPKDTPPSPPKDDAPPKPKDDAPPKPDEDAPPKPPKEDGSG